ncbi:DVUA0089 family protein [Celeribacter sp.]|uniref:DVUA0089 family protein n=1 Tax=Celeribacter sp. TaxID=1890673 RepID=UPI003A954D09
MNRKVIAPCLIALAASLIAEDVQALTVSTTFEGSVATMTETRRRGFFTETDTYSQMSAVSFSVTAGTFSFGVNAEAGSFDPFIYLFEDDGNLSRNDLISYNDDISYPNILDSYLSTTLATGNYIAIVGQWMWGENNGSGGLDYGTGIVNGNVYAMNSNWNNLPQNGTVEATYNYQITMTGENMIVDGVPAVPLPASLPLLLGAFAVPMLLRRRKKGDGHAPAPYAALPA